MSAFHRSLIASRARRAPGLTLGCLLLVASAARAAQPSAEPASATWGDLPVVDAGRAPDEALGAGERLLAATDPPPLRLLAAEVVERSPRLARARAEAAAAAARAPQVAALPDPSAMLTLFALPPETRVGPQRAAISLTQPLPWLDELALAERAALWAAAAAGERVEAERLALVQRVRERFYELAFATEHVEIAERERRHLVHHEELARALYSAGQGMQQGVIKLQAEIARAESRRLEAERRRAGLLAELNALRERPGGTPIGGLELPLPAPPRFDAAELASRAWRLRPERRALAAERQRRRLLVELAEKGHRPDLSLGLAYTLVDGRRDDAGRANPPQGDGDDVLALSAGIRLPVQRARVAAQLEEALQLEAATAAEERQLRQDLEREIGDLAARLPLLYEQWKLFDEVLLEQAGEAVRSAEGAYRTGGIGALELLHSEHVLFEVATAAARTRMELALAWSRLEAAVGEPLEPLGDALDSAAGGAS